MSTLSAKRRAYRPTARAVTAAYTSRVAELEREVASLRAQLEATRPRTDALYDVLGVARRFLARELLVERARGANAYPEGLEFDRNDALQRLRDTLFETRGALLRTYPRENPTS